MTQIYTNLFPVSASTGWWCSGISVIRGPRHVALRALVVEHLVCKAFRTETYFYATLRAYLALALDT